MKEVIIAVVVLVVIVGAGIRLWDFQTNYSAESRARESCVLDLLGDETYCRYWAKREARKAVQ